MQSFRQAGAGIMLGLISVLIVLGGISLSLAQAGLATTSISTDIPTEDATPGEVVIPTLPPLIVTETPQPDFTTTVTITPPPTLTNCPPPAGWVPIVVQSYDTLGSLAQLYGTSADLLRTNNCLLNDQLIANSILYVPPLPTATLIPCGPPPGWASYTVGAGDTLYRISLLYRVSVSALMQANCLATSAIRAGQTLRVPNVPTSTVPVSTGITPALTSTPSLTPELTATSTLPLPSPTETLAQPTPTLTEIPPSATVPPSEATSVPSITPTPGS